MSSILELDPGPQHQASVRIKGLDGYIRYWVPECINVNYPGYAPPGVCMTFGTPQMRRMDRVDAAELMADEIAGRDDLPLVWTRGPITMLKMEAPKEASVWIVHSRTHLSLNIESAGAFRYESEIVADGDVVTIDATLSNLSLWDWREAYVYFCCGLDCCPSLVDDRGDRTVIFTADGAKRLSELSRHAHDDFRQTAQYYEPEGKPMPRTEDGFAFDECAINPQRVTCGLVLRQSQDGRYVLAVGARRYRNVFVDLGASGANNCLHVNPLAGDLPADHAVRFQGSIHLLQCGLREAACEISRRLKMPIASLKGLTRTGD